MTVDHVKLLLCEVNWFGTAEAAPFVGGKTALSTLDEFLVDWLVLNRSSGGEDLTSS